MNQDILKDIINDFDPHKFIRFFRAKNTSFIPKDESLPFERESIFSHGKLIGEIPFPKEASNLIICTISTNNTLSERTGKKAQYELARKYLTQTQKEAGIFIFHDAQGNFRFSLIYPQFIGTRKTWSNFRRFTYFVSNELTNKTFLQRIGIGEFSTLLKIKDTFSVEKVTKEFYQDIANWYFWAVLNCRFPKDTETEGNGRNIAVIRLITRMIFIWFMRERGLINKDLFERQQIQNILKNLNNDESSYYTAILQNLFFATLSTNKEERDFRSEIRGYKGINPDRGNDNVYRYQKLFNNPQKLKEYFGSIPFLNGGLFECLDDRKNNYYVDGFTESKKDNQPEVPNLLFFGAEQKADLNKAYGTKNKTYKVRGLLDILSSFNFTIDENSPDDADIALDPELLGRVFENLLASFNPETSTTARKATGSYYTPREIVDYMVAESLKAYFKTQSTDIEKIDEKLEQLFSNESSENPFDEKQSKKLVELIESVKIVDPAVGSGAFPMGALNKLVFILNKIDPGNQLWKEVQLKATSAIPDPSARRMAKERIEEFFEGKNADYGRKLYLIQRCIYGVDIQQIAVEIAKLRFFISLLVDEKIDKEKDNWGIEPLPNLDFKIMQGNSLISEFLGIDFDNGNGEHQQEQEALLIDQDDDSLIKEFEQKKIDFQNEADKDKKAKLKQEIEDLMIQIFEIKVKQQKGDYFHQLEGIERKYSTLPNQRQREEIIEQDKRKLSKKSSFDLENIEKQLREFTSKKKTRPFFPWKLYFAEVFEKGGFDVVIGNPPYVSAPSMVSSYRELRRIIIDSKKYKSLYQKWDLYIPFMELGLQLLTRNGVFSMIVPYPLTNQNYGLKIRELIINDYCLREIVDLNGTKVFENATVSNCIPFITNSNPQNSCYVSNVNQFGKIERVFIQSNNDLIQDKNTLIWNLTPEKRDATKHSKLNVLGDYCYISKGMVLNADENTAKGEFSKDDLISETYDKIHCRKYIEAKDIERYRIKKERYLEYNTKRCPGNISRPTFRELYERPKLMFNRLGNLTVILDDEVKYLHSDSMFSAVLWKDLGGVENKSITTSVKRYSNLSRNEMVELSKCIDLRYLLGVLNSKYASRLLTNLRAGDYHIYPEHIRNIPIPHVSKKDQQPFISLVDQIIGTTKSTDYLQNQAKQAKVKEFEKQIDQLVYELYDLGS